MLEAPPTITPAESPAGTTPGLDALLTAAAFAPLPNRGFLRVTGEDRVRWLNGMATNSIQSLKTGQGNYNFFLNAQGRIQADATAWLLEDAILLETTRDRIPALITLLDHFIIMDDVELAPVERTGIMIAGPNALAIVQSIGGTSCTTPAPEAKADTTPSLRQTSYQGQPVELIHSESPLVPVFEVWSDAETLALITAELSTLPRATPEDLEALRILSGTPLFGTDIRDKDLPQETAQDARALHFAKGCYLGQEIVERIRSRGQVHRTFTGFLLECGAGSMPSRGTQLFTSEAPEKPVGELTSAARIQLPVGPMTLALGYIRREALTGKIIFQGGTATPSSLPYRT